MAAPRRTVTRFLSALRPILDDGLEPVATVPPRIPGTVFRPRTDRPAVMLGTEAERLASDGSFGALGEEIEFSGLLFAIDGRWRYAVQCSNPSSMVSDDWGIGEIVIGDTGYFFQVPDSDLYDLCPCPLLGGWAPARREATYRAAFLDTYERVWEDLTLPPALGECASTTHAPLLDAIDRAVGGSAERWAGFFGEVLDGQVSVEEWLSDWTGTLADSLHLDRATVERAIAVARHGSASSSTSADFVRVWQQGSLWLIDGDVTAGAFA